MAEDETGKLGSERLQAHIDGPEFSHCSISQAILHAGRSICIAIEDIARQLMLKVDRDGFPSRKP